MAKIHTTSSSAEFPFFLQRGSGEPLRQQLANAVRQAIQDSRLTSGMLLPSTRHLATELKVARSVVVDAYEQLSAEGYVIAQHGSGTRVATNVSVNAPTGAPPPARCRYDFTPGQSDSRCFPRAMWAGAVREIIQTFPDQALVAGDARGSTALRGELARSLRRLRGVVTDPDHIVVCTGFAEILRRLVRVQNIHQVAVEDPTHPALHALLERLGIAYVPIPVDANGIMVDHLMQADVQAILLTPAQQFPLGVTLSEGRRAQLLSWAIARDALIIEHDFDTEFGYDHPLMTALQAQAPTHVVYSGTISRLLIPTLHIAWMVAPTPMIQALCWERTYSPHPSPRLDCEALALLMATNKFDRHLRKVRQCYRRRRNALLAALEHTLPQLGVRGAGLQVILDLPPAVNETAVIQAAQRCDMTVWGLSACFAAITRLGVSPGLVLGYTPITESAIHAGIKQLGQIIQRSQ